MALGTGRILIPGFFRSSPTLAVFDVSHFLPLGGVGKRFFFSEDETRRHFSYLSGTSREYYLIIAVDPVKYLRLFVTKLQYPAPID